MKNFTSRVYLLVVVYGMIACGVGAVLGGLYVLMFGGG